MKQVLVSGGAARLEEVPAPGVEPGTVLVRMDHSCISIGTEMAGLASSAMPLWKRALRQPEKIRQAVDMIVTDGLARTRRALQERVLAESPAGYSGAGTVLEVGAGVDEFQPGDRVACAGAQCAFHAEVVRIPRNLAVAVPENLALADASTVALGAIALQGVRRAAPTLGETFVVLGLGVLGQLTVQLLRANGCRVIGVDPDRARIALAASLGMNTGVHPEDAPEVVQVARLTAGTGADGVIITAAGPSDEIVSTAFRMCRKKARVVLVGDVGLSLDRSDFYAKELDFLISTSYGPGRYDARYEEGGLDYPLAQVRWTENRNMGEYLRLAAEGAVRIAPLIAAVYPIAEAEAAYRSLAAGGSRPLMVLLSYPPQPSATARRVAAATQAAVATSGAIRVAVIGAGGYARGTHLPTLVEFGADYRLRAVVSRTGHNAASAAKRFGAEYSATDYREVLDDKNIDAVIIATRHDTHAAMALQALQAGKHVLVEKPLALEEAGLAALERYYGDGSAPKPVLLTGFNRRFSPCAGRIAAVVRQRSNPMIISYRMNAGYLPPDHWVHAAEGGGRNRGEACHIYDFFTFLTDARVKSVHASAMRPATGYYSSSDNFVATLCFDDGSVATLTYTALGSTAFPKETMDLFVDGLVISLDDYRSLVIAGSKERPYSTRTADKGQKAELAAFARAVRGETAWPAPLWQQAQATRASFEVERFISHGRDPGAAG
jgi:predicted dehydrogenase/threonine dehydrogenase-like Zn-dependent dehydrogenase